MLKVLELFAGIGACSKALEKLNINFEIVDAVEIDKFAIKSFNLIHNTNFEPQDITQWNKNVDVDLIMHGSPCQDFSLAGLQKGGDEGSGTRSSLMYETIRIVKNLKPKYVIWENVKNLLGKAHKHNFDNYILALNELGYNCYYKILNAKDFNLPQQRERVFTIAIKKEIDKNNFIFPSGIETILCINDFLENNYDSKMLVPEEKYLNVVDKIKNYKEFKSNKIERIAGIFDTISTHQAGSIYSKLGYCPTLDTMQGGYRQPLISFYENDKLLLRKLSPIECFKLMGFDREDCIKLINNKMSNTQLYKQAGNSICVKCLEEIFKNLFDI